ncbi:MAG: RNA-binding S4 domain-containing protein [Acidimicrobiales bacterium]
MEPARVDRWLWAVRVFKTRAEATGACKGGHVRVNDAVAKPATRVRPGDRVAAHVHGRDRLLEVVNPIGTRVGASQAITCFLDHTPPVPAREDAPFARTSGSGRPTKRDRRKLDRLRR